MPATVVRIDANTSVVRSPAAQGPPGPQGIAGPTVDLTDYARKDAVNVFLADQLVGDPQHVANVTATGAIAGASLAVSGAVTGGAATLASVTTPGGLEITAPGVGVTLKSPNGSSWLVTVSNSGVLTVAGV